MSKKQLLVSLILILGLGGFCLYLNRDSFTDKPIRISYRVSPWMRASRARRPNPADQANPVVFSLDQYYKIKEIKVFVADEIATNKYAHTLWHLVSETNSYPTASFTYGQHLRGMLPKVKNSRAEPLEPGVKYRLMLKTANQEAEHDFTTTAKN